MNFSFVLIADLNSDYIDMPFGRSGPGTPGMPGSNSRTKRMRTSFKHHQLRTMKSYFAINHNPDAKDLKQLSQKTGLPKRVLQVSLFMHVHYIFSYPLIVYFHRSGSPWLVESRVFLCYPLVQNSVYPDAARYATQYDIALCLDVNH